MAYISKNEIKNCINIYTGVKKSIGKENENDDINQIINLISTSIDNLEKIKDEMDNLNYSIENAIEKAKSEEQ